MKTPDKLVRLVDNYIEVAYLNGEVIKVYNKYQIPEECSDNDHAIFELLLKILEANKDLIQKRQDQKDVELLASECAGSFGDLMSSKEKNIAFHAFLKGVKDATNYLLIQKLKQLAGNEAWLKEKFGRDTMYCNVKEIIDTLIEEATK